MKKVIIKRSCVRLACLLAVAFAMTGCATYNLGKTPFQYTPSPNFKQIARSVGMVSVIDSRPKKDDETTRSVPDLMNEIKSKLVSDFKSSGVFKDVHSGLDDDIVATITVNRFNWRVWINSTPFNIIKNIKASYFGGLFQKAEGIADMSIELKDAKTGIIVGAFQESSIMSKEYPAGGITCGIELGDAFRDVVKKLKDDILTKTSL